jgi:2-dehydropantoate 2-reductase
MHQAGIDVTLLARGDRLRDLQSHGVRFAIHPSIEVVSVPVPVTSEMTMAGRSDCVFVVMQKQQAIDLTPTLAASRSDSTVVCYIGNNGTCVTDYREHIPEDYILLGFLGMGGHRLGDHMRLLVQKPTTIMLGTPSGKETPQLGLVGQVLRNVGLKVDVMPSIDAWLKCHLATILPLAGGIYAAGTDNYRLTRTSGLMRVVARAIKESLRVVTQLDYPLLPKQLSSISRVPARLLVWMFGKRFASVEAEMGLAGHAKAARDEMRCLSKEFQLLVDQSGVPTPNLVYLVRFLDPDIPTIGEGITHIDIW